MDLERWGGGREGESSLDGTEVHKNGRVRRVKEEREEDKWGRLKWRRRDTGQRVFCKAT